MSSHARNKVFTVVLGATRIPLKVFLPCEPSEFIESLWYSLPTELTLEAFRMRVTLSDEGGSRIAPTPRSIPDGFTIIVGLSRGDAASAAPHPTAPTSGVKRGREQGGQLHVLDGTADRAALADDGSPSSQHPEGSRFVAAPPQEAVAAAAAADADAAAVTAPAAPAAEPLLMFKPILRGVIIPLNGGGPQKHTWAGDWSMSTDDELRSPFKYTLDLSERYKVPPHMPGTVPANPLLPSNVSHQVCRLVN